MGNTSFMGGVSVVCTGDFGQLPPVGESIIWEKSFIDGRPYLSPNHWDENFTIFYLEEKMRSLDQEFSKISDKVRKGICDSEVYQYLKDHVKDSPNENSNSHYAEGKLSIIVTTNAERDRINLQKLEQLLPNEKAYTIDSKDEAIRRSNAPKPSKDLPHTQTGQLESTFIFRKGAPVMVTSNHSDSRYKNNGIVNGARGYIDSIQVSKESSDVEVVWVVFMDESTGRLLREDNKHLLKFHKPFNPRAVPIKKQRKRFHNNSWLREQFPLTLSYAVTAHKCQGKTLDEVIIDFSGKSRINAGSFYTAMSRVRFGSNLFLRDFKQEYIVANPDVEKKLQAMRASVPYEFKKVKLDTKIFELPNDELKIGYININSLYEGKSDSFLNEDSNLLELDFLAISDTRLTASNSSNELYQRLNNWSVIGRGDSSDGMKHMGMILLQSKRSKLFNEVSFKEWLKISNGKNMVFAQVTTLKLLESKMKISFIYIRETPLQKDLERFSSYMKDSAVILGDLNLNATKDEDHKKLTLLMGTSKQRVLHEVTTTRINQLDHILLDNSITKYFCTSFINHTSDHKAITIRLPIGNNELSQEFKQKYYFDREKWTKIPRKITDPDEAYGEVNWTHLDRYLEILNKAMQRKQVFFPDFHSILADKGFKHIPHMYVDIKVTKLEEVYIIVLDSQKKYIQKVLHWTSKDLTLTNTYSESNLKQHQNDLIYLKWFKNEYIDRLYQSFSLTPKKLNLKVECISDNFKFDVKSFVNMVTYLKHVLLEGNLILPIDFKHESKNIASELKSQKLFPLPKVPQKRKGNLNESVSKRSKLTYRTFGNPNMESCWLNSCMQLVLTALDHSIANHENGSSLMKLFIEFQNSDQTKPLNPLVIRDVLLEAEVSRINSGNIQPQDRYFQFAGSQTTNLKHLKKLSETRNIGQQDCKDFFLCLEANKQQWFDVYEMFKFQLQCYTKCSDCGKENLFNLPDKQFFLTLDSPDDHVSITEFVQSKFNEPERYEGWKDQSGCGRVSTCLKYSRIDSTSNIEFLILVVKRLSLDERGNLTINQKRIEITDLSLQATYGVSLKFKPIAVIYHSGNVVGKDTRGHYMADVLDFKTNQWIRTSDDDTPKAVLQPSNQGYIYLFKKVV